MFIFSKNGMGDYVDGTGMREDMHMQPFNIGNYQAGVVLPDDLEVTVTSPASMAVKVAKGRCFVANSSYVVNTANSTKYWGVLGDEEQTVAIATNTSGSTRVDLIVVTVDPGAAPDGYGENVAEVAVVQGSPGSGAPAMPDHSLLLATLTIPTATTTEINAGMIADNRVLYGTSRIKNVDGNIEVRYGNSMSVIETIVPKSGSLTAALTSATRKVTILASDTVSDGYTYFNLPAAVTLNTKIKEVVGVGHVRVTSGIADGGTILTIAGDHIKIHGFVIDGLNAAISRTVILLAGYGNSIDLEFENFIGTADVLVKGANVGTHQGANAAILNIRYTFPGGSGSQSCKLFGGYFYESSITALAAYVLTGNNNSTWEVSGSNNFIDVVCDDPGADNGAGNIIREINY